MAVTDRYGWAYFCNNGLFLTDSNQVRPAVKEAGAYMRLDQKTYFTSENNLENGRFIFMLCPMCKMCLHLWSLLVYW
nr:hypothetical protein [Clostridium sp. AM51-4]